MIVTAQVQRFFVAEYSIDFRKGHESLISETKRLGIQIYNGDVIAFINKNRTKIKILIGDNTGVTLIYKIFSKGKMGYKVRFLESPNINQISYAEIMMLLEGNSYTIHHRAKKWLPQILP